MTRGFEKLTVLLLGLPLVALPLACTGDDGKTGPPGPSGTVNFDASNTPPDVLADLDVVSEITDVQIASPPVVTFTYKTADGTPIVGLVPIWEANNRFVRFTLTKLVPGQGGDPDSWVAYVRDNGEPDYDSGASLVDNGDGSYVFTFNTDVTNVAGVMYEPGLTHRVAGQIGQLSTVPLEEQNLWLDFVPNGSPVMRRRDIATVESCNECHDRLVFHGRRFEVQYCVQCHNPDLAMGEGNFSFMIHRIHAGGSFAELDGGADFSEVTYPQDLMNCRKCHDSANAMTPQGGNWLTKPNMVACDGCHDNFSTGTHTGGPQANNLMCTVCHPMNVIEGYHTTTNATPHNPNLLMGQRNITYELVDAAVDGGTNDVTINFRILSDGMPLDVTNLPMDLVDPGDMLGYRYPSFLLAWAMPQDGIDEPGDFNNLGERSAQPLDVGLEELDPIDPGSLVGTLSYDAMSGVMTAVITEGASQFPVDATLRTVGLQDYMQQDLNADGTADASLHTLSVMTTVMGDKVRRAVVDTANCSRCHEWFEGHGGSRVLGFGSDAICTMCHVPNLSSSGRAVVDPTLRGLDDDIADAIADGSLDPMVDPNNPRTYPEDAQNFKDMIHGIHSSGFRGRSYQHVRGPGRQGYYDWSEVTFPHSAETSNCLLCHADGTYELPLDDDLLPTTVRTTGQMDGLDPDLMTAEAAFQGVPNDTDWVNTPTASACFYCHTSAPAQAHMSLNGALVSDPRVGGVVAPDNRDLLGDSFESCSICHGPGRVADLELVHNR